MFKQGDENAAIAFNINKAKYVNLSEHFTRLEVNKINIIVDTAYLFRAFRASYLYKVASTILTERLSENMAAEFFNWIGHYRRYFATIGFNTTFYICHGIEDSFADSLGVEWNLQYKNEFNKFLDFIVNKRLSIIAESVPEVYVINSNLDSKNLFDRSIIPYMIDKHFSKGINMLMSNDLQFMNFISAKKNTICLKADSRSVKSILPGKLFSFLSQDLKSDYSNITDNQLKYYLALKGNRGVLPFEFEGGKNLTSNKILKLLLEVKNPTIEDIAKTVKVKPTSKDEANFNKLVTLYDQQSRYKSVSISLESKLENQLVTNPDFKFFSSLCADKLGNSVNTQPLFMKAT